MTSDTGRRVTVVPDELQAGMVCSMLEAHGIPCTHRRTSQGGIDWGAINVGMGGYREVLVPREDFEAASELLRDQEELDVAPVADESPPRPARTSGMQRAFQALVLLLFGVPLLIWLTGILRDILRGLG